MFHLLVSYQGWEDSGGSLSIGRVYIRSDDPVGSTFYSNGQLDITKIRALPALLVTETNGSGPQFARVAHITNITQGHSEISIQYAIDNSISPISNAELETHTVELSLGRFGLSHTCWRLCDVDLYKLLLQNQHKRDVKPKVFSLDAIYTQDENLVSIMMPLRL